MIDRYKHQQLRIGPVSPQQIRAWANKTLPNGEIVEEVTKPYTFHYITNKLEKDGLFYERISGPIKSGICACGNYRVIGAEKEDPKFCEECGVEFVDSRIQRYQMGYCCDQRQQPDENPLNLQTLRTTPNSKKTPRESTTANKQI